MGTEDLSWEELRTRVHELGTEVLGQASSIPMLVKGHEIRMAASHPWYEQLNGVRLPSDGEQSVHRCTKEAIDERQTIRNRWWSDRLGCEIIVVWHGQPAEPDFRVEILTERYANSAWIAGLRRWAMVLETLDAGQQAWAERAELRAMASLAGMISQQQMATYLMTGLLPEKSERSGAGYFFRRCRPTVVMLHQRSGHYRAAVTLCLHPLAYYNRTYAGGMVPTDDVIAHLALMRADEHGFWKKSSQHPIGRLEAGV